VKNRTAIRWAQNPVLAALLLVAFFSRALIPTGFMPGPGGLTVCPSYGPAMGAAAMVGTSHGMPDTNMSAMDMPGMDMSHHTVQSPKGGGAPDHELSGFCPFAAAATTMVSGHVATQVTVAQVVTLHIDFPAQPFVPRGTIVPTSLPRGPPLVLA